MAVAVENTSSKQDTSGAGVTSTTGTMAVTSANALIALISLNNASNTPTVTWDSGGTNQAMTVVGQSTGVFIYGLLAPTTGTKTYSVSWTGSSNFGFALVGLTSVTQTSLAAAFTNANSGSSFTTAPGQQASIAINTALGNAVFACAQDNDTTASALTGTQLFLVNAPVDDFVGNYSLSLSSSVTLAYTIGNSFITWTYTGINVVAGAGGGDTLQGGQRILMMRERMSVGWRRVRGLLVPDREIIPAWEF